LRHLVKNTIAAWIFANGTDKADFVPQVMRVQGKVKGCAAQVFGFWKNVPEDLTD